MEQNPKISVIVPVYKAEAYLSHCVDSLLAQTFKDFEILLIDDGSPDRSGEICDMYARKDDRVRVFHQKNSGVSMARQKGLDEARGEYVIHADPDDWVEPDMLQELYAKAKEDDADMVICDFYENKGDRQQYLPQRPSALDHDTVFRELFQQLHGSCWNKLVRRVCYNEYNIRFFEGLNYKEDFCVSVLLASHDIKIAYLNKAFYHYTIGVNANSLNQRIDNSKIEDCLRVISFCMDNFYAKYPQCCYMLQADFVSWMIEQRFYSRWVGMRIYGKLLKPSIFFSLPLKRRVKLLLAFFATPSVFKAVYSVYRKKAE